MADKVDPAFAEAAEAARAAQQRFTAAAEAKDSPESAPGLDRPEDGFEVFGTAPEVWELGASKTKFVIAPLKVRQIRGILPVLTQLQEPLAAMFKTGEVNISALQRIDSDGLVECVAICTEQTSEAVDDLTAEDFIRVCTKVLAVNGDFFVRTLPRVAGGAAAAILRLATGAAGTGRSGGPLPSSDSSAPVIPSKA